MINLQLPSAPSRGRELKFEGIEYEQEPLPSAPSRGRELKFLRLSLLIPPFPSAPSRGRELKYRGTGGNGRMGKVGPLAGP